MSAGGLLRPCTLPASYTAPAPAVAISRPASPGSAPPHVGPRLDRVGLRPASGAPRPAPAIPGRRAGFPRLLGRKISGVFPWAKFPARTSPTQNLRGLGAARSGVRTGGCRNLRGMRGAQNRAALFSWGCTRRGHALAPSRSRAHIGKNVEICRRVRFFPAEKREPPRPAHGFRCIFSENYTFSAIRGEDQAKTRKETETETRIHRGETPVHIYSRPEFMLIVWDNCTNPGTTTNRGNCTKI